MQSYYDRAEKYDESIDRSSMNESQNQYQQYQDQQSDGRSNTVSEVDDFLNESQFPALAGTEERRRIANIPSKVFEYERFREPLFGTKEQFKNSTHYLDTNHHKRCYNFIIGLMCKRTPCNRSHLKSKAIIDLVTDYYYKSDNETVILDTHDLNIDETATKSDDNDSIQLLRSHNHDTMIPVNYSQKMVVIIQYKMILMITPVV